MFKDEINDCARDVDGAIQKERSAFAGGADEQVAIAKLPSKPRPMLHLSHLSKVVAGVRMNAENSLEKNV
jgi:hypothetical protein